MELGGARALRVLAPIANMPILFLAENCEEARRVARARVPLAECLVAPFDLAEIRAHAWAALLRKPIRTAREC